MGPQPRQATSFWLYRSDQVATGQIQGEITCTQPAANLGHHFLARFFRLIVLFRLWPDRKHLENVVRPILYGLRIIEIGLTHNGTAL